MDVPQPPSGEQIEIRHGRQRAVVVTGGGGIRRYVVGDQDILDGYTETEVVTGGRGQLLIPWPNRIRDGRYVFDGEERQLALSEPAAGNAIHGLVRGHTWVAGERDTSRVVLSHRLVAQQGYPHTLQLEAEYVLSDGGLAVQVTAINVGAAPAPYGAGAHPYLRPAAGLVDVCTLRVPAAARLVTDERQIPAGREPVDGTDYDFRSPRRLGGMRLDTAFTELTRDEDGLTRVELHDPAAAVTLTLWMDAAHDHVMVFTGDTLRERCRQGIAVEPMTCPPNAFATGQSLVVLDPGASHTSVWGITPSGITL